MYALLIVGFLMGQRPGELAALKWEHINFRKGVLFIVKYRRATGDGATKTLTSRRALSMPGRVRAALVAHQAAFGEHEYVFAREDGKQVYKDAMSWRVGKAFRAGGLHGVDDPVRDAAHVRVDLLPQRRPGQEDQRDDGPQEREGHHLGVHPPVQPGHG